MRLKKGVKIGNIQPQTVVAMMIVDQMLEHFVVTSITDGKHMKGSKHYEGLAFDVRTRDLDDDHKGILAVLIRENLGDEYDVVIEPTHIHIEYDPK